MNDSETKRRKFIHVGSAPVQLKIASQSAKNCIAYESTYQVEKDCSCLIFMSNGGSSGYFSSPDYPFRYPANISCILYTFVGEADEIVEINLISLNIFGDDDGVTNADAGGSNEGDNTCNDYLSFFLNIERPEIMDRQLPDHVICGNLTGNGKKYYSSDRSLIVEFHSGPRAKNTGIKNKNIKTNNNINIYNINNNIGFNASFRFIDKRGSLKWGTKCSYDFRSRKTIKIGVLFSPHYPQTYPTNVTCTYNFYALQTEVISLTFTHLKIGRGDDDDER
ncbi:hypothetical protein HELRODRAFT_174796 [Helobdella robusta]|uniref:CUB domain-containing protein n=1 Tax=Helobdella robusta TaxID=6412 RepID=T1F8H4_HELRO|nr:hypothetical protein HELRODRAFT_174796 [Helobdella robusta]ESO01249.1 hypothetical protein HELRODRAFT_174796 [Helobdella robusta]